MAGEMKYGITIGAIDKASAVLKSVEGSLASVGKVGVNLGANLGKVSESMNFARENVADFTGRLKDGIGQILAPAAAVEGALAKLSAKGVTDLGSLKNSALEWSKAHRASADQYIGTVDRLMTAGLDQATAIKAAEAALATSTATGKENAAITETLSVLYGQMGNKTANASSEFSRLGDIMTRAQQVFGGIDVGALADPLKDALPAAKANRISIGETIAVLGQLNSAGIKGGEAGAGFAAVLDSIGGASKALGFNVVTAADGSTNLIATLQGIEAKFGRIDQMTPEMAAKFQSAFGGGYKAVSSLLGQTGKLAQGYDAISNSTGATAAAQKALEETSGAALLRIQRQVDAAKIQIADGLSPAIQAVAPHILTVVNAIGGFAKEHPKVVGFVGTIAVMAVAIGTVVAPVMSAIGAISAIAGALATAATAEVTFAGTTYASIVPAISAAISATLAWTAALLTNPITWIVLAMVAAVALIYVYWEPISTFFVKLWGDIKSAFVGAWASIVAMWDGAVSWVTGIFDGIRDAFSVSFVDGILHLLETFSPVALIAKGFNAVSEWLFGFSLADAGANIVKTIGQGISSMASAPVDAMMGVVQKVRNLLPFSPAKDGPLRDLHKVKLVETVADAVKPAPLVNAMSSAAGDAMAALQSPPIPASLMGAGESRARGASSSSSSPAATATPEVHFHFGGDAKRSFVDQLEDWIRNPSNASRLAAAVQAVNDRDARARFA